jgi:hypothetical protein
MKFYGSIHRLLKQFFLVAIFFLLSLGQLLAQTNTKSPYSFYGLGDVESSAFAESMGMGDVKYAISNPYQINIANPASITSLNVPTFSAGAFFNTVQTSGEGVSQSNSNAYLRYIALAFPLGKQKRVGFGFGLTPHTKMGYSILETQELDDLGTVDKRYLGEGGINRAYMNFGYAIVKDSLNFLSVGVTPSFYFGTINRSARVLFAGANAYNTISENQLHVKDINAEFGLNYKRRLPSKKSTQKLISVGATYELQKEMSAEDSRFVFSTSPTGFPKDTVINRSVSGAVSWPQKIGVGLAFEISSDSIGRWLIGADYERIDWSAYQEPGSSTELNNRQQISVGAQYIPDDQAFRNFFKIMRYRIGAYYANTRLNVGNEQVDDIGISLGIGIPLIGSGTLDPTSSTVNVSANFGQRGANQTGLIQERYSNIVVGFTFTPGKWDQWFKKRRIQ